MSKIRPPYPTAFREQRRARASWQEHEHTVACRDNAMAESFFATLECELIARRAWKSKAEAHTAVFMWIGSWHNPWRRHSTLNHQSLMNFERNRHEQERVLQPLHPEHGLTAVSLGSSQAPTDAVNNSAASTIQA